MGRKYKRKNNKISNIIVVILLLLLAFVVFLKIDDVKNNNKKNNSTKETKNETKVNKTNDNDKKETKTDENKNIDVNKEVEKSSGPAKTEAEENKKERITATSINLELVGDSTVTIKKGSKYVDEGFTALDSDGNDISDLISTESDVDTSKTGKYTVTYYYGKSVVIRRVIVEE